MRIPFAVARNAPAQGDHSSGVGAVDRLLEAWEAAKRYEGMSAESGNARNVLKVAMIDASQANNPAPFCCPHRLVLCFIHAAHVWCDGAYNGQPRRNETRELVDLIASEIRAWRKLVIGGGA